MQTLDPIPATAPASEPVEVSALKMHARIDAADEDTNIAIYAKSCRRTLENILGISFIETTWDEYLDRFPSGPKAEIKLTKAPLMSITSITYTNSAGQSQTLVEGTDFVVDLKTRRIWPKFGMVWPVDVEIKPSPIRIRYKAGFGAAASAVPDDLIVTLYLFFSQTYKDRDPLLDYETHDVPFPVGLRQLLTNHTNWSF